MKSFIAFVAVAVVFVSAVPVFEEYQVFGGLPESVYEEGSVLQDAELRQKRDAFETYPEEVEFEEAPEHGLRYKRATCDATSFTSKWVTINHSACALHCIVKGNKGGYCKNTICHCRN